jgi:hypothetical protein
MKFSSALADYDRTGRDYLPPEAFDSKSLGIAVTPIPYASLTFFVCHAAFSLFNSYIVFTTLKKSRKRTAS